MRAELIQEVEYFRRLKTEARGVALAVPGAPPPNLGLFGVSDYDEWAPDVTYARETVLRHGGSLWYVKQDNLLSLAIYPPGSVGTEALYGARPLPGVDGVYPYVYNMAASVGMLVRDGDKTYRCIQAANEVLYRPGELPAIFEEAQDVG